MSKWILAVALFWGQNLIANEAPPAATAKDPKSEKPWLEVQNRIAMMKTKSKQFDDRLHSLIAEKKHGPSAERMRALDKEIDEVYKQWKISQEELRKEEQIFRYRFPERVAKESERVYQIQEIPTLEKIEEQVGIEGKLNRNIGKMRGQYGKPDDGTIATPPPVEKVEVIKEEGQKNIREQNSPILKK